MLYLYYPCLFYGDLPVHSPSTQRKCLLFSPKIEVEMPPYEIKIKGKNIKKKKWWAGVIMT